MDDMLLHIDKLSVISVKSSRHLLRQVTLSIKKHQSLALVGENGSGKTTLARAILGFLPESCRITTGKILFRGQETTGFTKKEFRQLRGKKIAVIPQNALNSLTPSMRIGSQLIETIRAHRSLSKQEAYQKALELLSDVHIAYPERYLQAYPFELSGGMRQRIVIAIALASSPELILADEPTTALDSISQAQILHILKSVHQEKQTAMLLVTHNLALVTELCDTVAIIQNGEIIEYGAVKEVFMQPCHPYTIQLLHAVSKILHSSASAPIFKTKPQPLK